MTIQRDRLRDFQQLEEWWEIDDECRSEYGIGWSQSPANCNREHRCHKTVAVLMKKESTAPSKWQQRKITQSSDVALGYYMPCKNCTSKGFIIWPVSVQWVRQVWTGVSVYIHFKTYILAGWTQEDLTTKELAERIKERFHYTHHARLIGRYCSYSHREFGTLQAFDQMNRHYIGI